MKDEKLQKLVSAWKSNSHHSAEEMVHYIIDYGLIKANMLDVTDPNFNAIGLKIWDRLQKALPSVKNRNKLNNGRYPHDTLKNILYRIIFNEEYNLRLKYEAQRISGLTKVSNNRELLNLSNKSKLIEWFNNNGCLAHRSGNCMVSGYQWGNYKPQYTRIKTGN